MLTVELLYEMYRPPRTHFTPTLGESYGVFLQKSGVKQVLGA